jgi:hypothetical protein
MSDFVELNVNKHGSGPYHFNRYRVVFALPANTTKESLAGEFVREFPQFFNSDHATVAFHANRLYLSYPTYEFHGVIEVAGIDVAKPHNDWVARIWCDPDIGFTAQTVKRTFIDPQKDAPIVAAGCLAGAAAVPDSLRTEGCLVGARLALDTNQSHFLAGRRSWRLDSGKAFGLPGNVCVLETIAVERFSSALYRAGDYLMQLEERIPAIWTANLSNFVRLKKLTTLSMPDLEKLATNPSKSKRNWHVGDEKYNIRYFRTECDTLAKLKYLPEFVEAYPLYPTILPT